jgi:hypothetical protein
MLRVVPGSIPGETLLLHVVCMSGKLFYGIERKRDEMGRILELFLVGMVE